MSNFFISKELSLKAQRLRSCHDTLAVSSVVTRSPLQLRWSGTRFQTLFRTQRAEHWQLQIVIKDSSVRGATGHV